MVFLCGCLSCAREWVCVRVSVGQHARHSNVHMTWSAYPSRSAASHTLSHIFRCEPLWLFLLLKIQRSAFYWHFLDCVYMKNSFVRLRVSKAENEMEIEHLRCPTYTDGVSENGANGLHVHCNRIKEITRWCCSWCCMCGNRLCDREMNDFLGGIKFDVQMK